MTNRSDLAFPPRTALAVEWADEHMERLQASRKRRNAVMRERFEPTPEYLEAKAFEAKTEQLRRYLRRESEKTGEKA